MLIDNKNDFIKYIPTADGWEADTSDDNVSELFNNFKPQIEEAEIWVQSELLGQDLITLAHSDETLKDAIGRVIACNAYYSGIPFVDLLLTPTGFAVVSTQTQAPASKERVERLLQWLNKRLSWATDELIKLVFQNKVYNEKWKGFELYEYYTECIIMTASSFCRYVKKEALRADLEENHAVLMQFQNDIAKMISSEYMQYLISARRNSSLSTEDIQIINALMTIIGMKFRGETAAVYSMLENLVNTMEDSIDNFPAYRDSITYQVKTSKKYENKKDDPTFFF